MVMHKRGQGLSINALILIVLGIFILVTLIAGFTLGWSQLKSYLGFSGNNVDTVVSQCNNACELQQQYAFCTQERTLKLEDGLEVKGSCAFFATPGSPYKIPECSQVSCGTCQDLFGQKLASAQCSQEDRILTAGNVGNGQVCCKQACTAVTGASVSLTPCSGTQRDISGQVTGLSSGQFCCI